MTRELPTLPYRWWPDGTKICREPTVGTLIPLWHEVWRVIDVRKQDDLPDILSLRRANSTSIMTAESDDLHIGRKSGIWHVYPDEHYPICAKCHEPQPCREQMAERLAAEAAKRMTAFERAGVCPACSEVVTHRQERATWAENAMLPGGPPITYHLRRKCLAAAIEYERSWAEMLGHNPQMSCQPSSVIRHGDGTYECSRGDLCPGSEAWHMGSATVCSGAGCSDPACLATPARDCHPRPGDTRRTRPEPRDLRGSVVSEEEA